MIEEMMNLVYQEDEEVGQAIKDEYVRQNRNIELIASENIVSPAVLYAMGSVLTNKYAEGYPGKRYYGGCENVDVVENIAIERVKKLFGCEYANVQPHSGAQANMAVFFQRNCGVQNDLCRLTASFAGTLHEFYKTFLLFL